MAAKICTIVSQLMPLNSNPAKMAANFKVFHGKLLPVLRLHFAAAILSSMEEGLILQLP